MARDLDKPGELVSEITVALHLTINKLIIWY